PITAEDFEVFFNVYEEFLFENSGISVIYDSIYIPSERNFLHLIAENTLGLINNNVQIPKHLLSSGQEYEKALQTIKELPLSIIDKKIKYKREGKTSYIYHNEKDKVDLLESASGLQSVVPILLLVEYSKSLKEKYNFNFVVEEPELNLYPKAQHELIKYLVKNCLFDRKNLILTTHSPFVLASINNLLLAYDKGQKNPKEVNKIIKKESWLNPKNFIAYELKNGKAKKIMNDKLGQISENMIDGVSDAFANEFDKLLDL
ncbi:AAA family ATPase, partial [Flavobacterium chungangense]